MTSGEDRGPPNYDTSSVVAFYDRLAPSYDELRFGAFKDRVGRAYEERIITGFLDRMKGKSVLDVGSGTGRIANLILGRFQMVVLAEPAPGMLRVLSSTLAFGLSHIIRTEVEHLPFSDDSFDLITCLRVVWHLPGLENAIAEMARVLKPGGFVLFDVANSMSLTHMMERIRGSEVEMVFTGRKEVAKQLGMAGLAVVAFEPHRSAFLQIFPVRLDFPASWAERFTKIEDLVRNVPIPRCTLSLIAARKD